VPLAATGELFVTGKDVACLKGQQLTVFRRNVVGVVQIGVAPGRYTVVFQRIGAPLAQLPRKLLSATRAAAAAALQARRCRGPQVAVGKESGRSSVASAKKEAEQEVDGFSDDGKIRRFGCAREEKRGRSASTQSIVMHHHVSHE
jgi:hypothetical protein